VSAKPNFNPLSPDSIVKYLASKGLTLTYDYDELLYSAHHRAFTVAKVTRLDLLKDLQDAVSGAIAKGTPFSKFKKDLKPILQKKGWWGEQEITNPKTGEVKKVYIGSRRLKNILATNRQVAYAQGRYKQQQGFINAVYLRYGALQHGNRREDHQAQHGIILHKDHIWWDTNYPPNGWGCKCYTTAHTKSEIEDEGWEIYKGIPKNIAHKDWAYHVGKTDNTQNVYKQKVEDLAKPCKEDNAKGKNPCHKKLSSMVGNQYKKDTKTLKDRLVTYLAVKELFSKTNKTKEVELCKSDIFGENKRVLLSRDTVQSHLDREDVSAFHYFLIPQLLEGKKYIFEQKETTYIVVKKLGNGYRLAIKNIKDKNEIYVVSLVNLGSNIDREIKKLQKKYKMLQGGGS